MALTRKQDDGGNKKEQGKKETGQKRNIGRGRIPALDKVLNNKGKDSKQKTGGQKSDKQKTEGQKTERKETGKKDIALVREKRDVAGKEVKKTYPVKKEKVNYIEVAQKFIKGAYGELKKVNWPGRKELVVYTIVVVVAVLFVGALLWIFDSALSTVLRFVINR